MALQLNATGHDNEETDEETDEELVDLGTNTQSIVPPPSLTSSVSNSNDPPALFHKVKNQKSILVLVVSDSKIYAGTQGGEILVSQCHSIRIVSEPYLNLLLSSEIDLVSGNLRATIKYRGASR